MAVQKQAVLELVETHRGRGRSVGEVLGSVGVARSSYYRWKKNEGKKKDERHSSYELTVEERQMIEAVKESHPEYRHRRIQGMLQQQGVYLSASAIYGHLKAPGLGGAV
jgi:transposase